MVSGIGEICAIGWGTFGGLVVCIGCCEKITNQNSISVSSYGSTSFGSNTSQVKDKNGKTVTIQPYKNNYLIKELE